MEGMEGMEGMDMGSMEETMRSDLLGGAGDVDYPEYLVNGRTAGAPATLTCRPGSGSASGSSTLPRTLPSGSRWVVTG